MFAYLVSTPLKSLLRQLLNIYQTRTPNLSGMLVGIQTGCGVIVKRPAQAEHEEQLQQEQGGEIEIINVSDYKPRRIPPPTWRECIKKIWEVDPLECPKCHGEMKIISFINEKPVIRKILKHLSLWRETQRGPPTKVSLQPEIDVAIREFESDPFDDGWPVYEEPFVIAD